RGAGVLVSPAGRGPARHRPAPPRSLGVTPHPPPSPHPPPPIFTPSHGPACFPPSIVARSSTKAFAAPLESHAMSDDRTSPSATERIRVEVIEWARGNPAPIESVLETVELSLDDTIIFLAPFVDDGYTILV